MHLAQDNDVVYTLTPDRSDQPFGKAVLPGRGWRGRLVPDAHRAQSACDDAAIDPILIADEVTRSFIPRKCLRYLTCNPFCRRICCDVDPDQVSAVEPDDDEGIEQVETDSWNNEQVHGGNVWRVVMQEGSPSLAGRPPAFDHVLGDARLRDLKSELEQFAVDAWRAPKRIFDAHSPDQHAQLRFDLRSPSQWARLPTPVATKAGPMPTHERLGPDDCENLQDSGKPAIQLDKEPAIMVREPDATRQPTPHDIRLMSKHRVLSFKPQLRLEWRGQDGQNETEQPDHSASLSDSITSSTRIRFSVHTRATIFARRLQIQERLTAQIAEQGCAGVTRRRTGGTHSLPSDLGWIVSPLCPNLIYDRHRSASDFDPTKCPVWVAGPRRAQPLHPFINSGHVATVAACP